MRPSLLDPLFADVTGLSGVGEKTAHRLERAFGRRGIDLLCSPPVGRIDRRHAPPLDEARSGEVVTLLLTVVNHIPPRHRKQPYRIVCQDETGELELLFFNGRAPHLQKLLPEGEQRVVSGTVEIRGEMAQMAHPDHVVDPERESEVRIVEPVRRLTEGVSRKQMNRMVAALIERIPTLPEWCSPETMGEEQWPDWTTALKMVHFPVEDADLERSNMAYRRLAHDELLAQQLSLALLRHHSRGVRHAPASVSTDGPICTQVRNLLPFALTREQETVLMDISADMAAERPMYRLLQGDVGSGKTVVALLAMLRVVETGRQAALMAPTDLLIRQHAETVRALLAECPVDVVLLTGRETGNERVWILDRIKSGAAQIILGTHALFQDSVEFSDLGLVVVDEQHRFGVRQRAALLDKGRCPDFLAMSATPIPRTLALARYGDMDVSRLREKPAGRQPVDTRIISQERFDEILGGLRRLLESDDRIFWVCPSIDQGEGDSTSSAESRYDVLKSALGGDVVGLIHGRIPNPEKDRVLEAFSSGRKRVLVSTTVVEVGIDVPEASVMVIERAERFGLSQLHQLRGRVGRGSKPGFCLLLYGDSLNDQGRTRLEVLRQSNDGFWIAEQDLQSRGAGEMTGVRQAGQMAFHFADLAVHQDLLERANQEARHILNQDPGLESVRGQALRILLHLFEREFEQL